MGRHKNVAYKPSTKGQFAKHGKSAEPLIGVG